jgi:hypothetical protein
MYSITINGNSLDELIASTEKLLALHKCAVAPPPNQPPPQPIALQPPAAPQAQPPQFQQPPPALQPSPPQTAFPIASPTYSRDDIARAGATLAQTKMTECLAVLAKYGASSLDGIKPENYAAVAADLRTLGAQI